MGKEDLLRLTTRATLGCSSENLQSCFMSICTPVLPPNPSPVLSSIIAHKLELLSYIYGGVSELSNYYLLVKALNKVLIGRKEGSLGTSEYWGANIHETPL